MTAHLIAALALLVVPAVLPSLALLGPRPTTVFLAPLVGAMLAGVAAELEAAFAGTLLTWFVILAVMANAAAVGWFYRRGVRPPGLRRRRERNGGAEADATLARPGPRPRVWRWPSAWACVTVVVMALAVAWPLQVLRTPFLANDGFFIWTLHSLFAYGGHSVLEGSLKNPVYGFSNPSYPPLVSASGALGFVAEGGVDLRLAAMVTALLNACALAAAGCAIVAIVEGNARTVSRLTALAAGSCVCLIGFGLSGVYGVGGYADLLWAASALAAVILGLVLPPSHRNAAAAWVCATVAGLTKTEGFVTACIILALVAVRFVPRPHQSVALPLRRAERGRRTLALAWTRWAVKVSLCTVVMALPGFFWVVFVKDERIGSSFVGPSGQPIRLRFDAAVPAVWANLHIVALAAGVAAVGALALSRTRRRSSLGNDLWLWIVVAGSLFALLLTYVLGGLEIHWWLSNSVNRTTIFESLTLYGDLAVWLTVAASFESAVDSRIPPSASVSVVSGEHEIAENAEDAGRRVPHGAPER